jgi:hypothetical protein
MKALILNSCIVALKNKAGMKEASTYNRTGKNENKSAVNDHANTSNERPFQKWEFSKKYKNEFVDFSGGLLGI